MLKDHFFSISSYKKHMDIIYNPYKYYFAIPVVRWITADLELVSAMIMDRIIDCLFQYLISQPMNALDKTAMKL